MPRARAQKAKLALAAENGEGKAGGGATEFATRKQGACQCQPNAAVLLVAPVCSTPAIYHMASPAILSVRCVDNEV